MTNFQNLLFPGYRANWHEALLETLAIVLVALPTLLVTKRLLDRLYYMEGFLRMCAWCRRLDSNGQWVKVENYFQDQFALDTTHGICPECYQKQVAD